MSAALRLYDGSESNEPPRQTLQALFEELTLPHLEELGRVADTISEYQTHLDRWHEFWAAGGPASERTKHKDTSSLCSLFPPNGKEVTSDHLLSFRRWVGQKYQLSARTKNKHIGSLERIIERAHKLGRLPSIIKIDPLPEISVAPKYYFVHEQLEALYRGCGAATWPERNAPDQWRSLVVMWFFYGQRTQEAVTFDKHHRPLMWGQIAWDEETPNPEGHARCPYGWMNYVPQKQKRHKPGPLYLPLTEVAAAHLRAIVPNERPPADTPVFDWPRCNKKFYETWQAIVQAAHVRPKGPASEKFLPKHLRKTCATMLNNHRRSLGDLVLGHADRNLSRVQATHYDNPEEYILEGLLSLPVPPAFRQIFDRRQLLLF